MGKDDDTDDDKTGGKPDDDKAGGKPDTDNDDALKRALDAERRKARDAENQLKALRLEMAKLKNDADSSKTDQQKLMERIEAAEKKAAAAEARQLRAEVAQERGLTPAQAKRLAGSTREELEADADDLLEAFKPATKADAKDGKDGDGKDGDGKDGKGAGDTSADGKDKADVDDRRRPKEKLRAGASPEGEEKVDAAKLAKSILDSPF